MGRLAREDEKPVVQLPSEVFDAKKRKEDSISLNDVYNLTLHPYILFTVWLNFIVEVILF